MAARTAPLWTRARLTRVMSLRFGINQHGGVDTAAAAAAMGVSRRTVQRWLHARHGRSIAHIPAKRLAQLLGLLLPSAETRQREDTTARYAHQAIARISDPGPAGVNPSWTRQKWLEPHRVVVLEVRIHQLRIRQLAVGRDTDTKRRELAKRGRIVDEVVVPTRFHATALTHQVLTDLAPWRFQAGEDQVVAGFTQAWLADAPRTNLTATAQTL